jgi:uncharacterized membrane protein YtjA (UPF0391 family)
MLPVLAVVFLIVAVFTGVLSFPPFPFLPIPIPFARTLLLIFLVLFLVFLVLDIV